MDEALDVELTSGGSHLTLIAHILACVIQLSLRWYSRRFTRVLYGKQVVTRASRRHRVVRVVMILRITGLVYELTPITIEASARPFFYMSDNEVQCGTPL